MRITNEQQRKLDRLRCLRVKDAPTDILNEIKGPKVNGQDATLVDLFRNPNYLQDKDFKQIFGLFAELFSID